MTDSNKAWNEFRKSLKGLISTMRREVAAHAPRVADEMAAAAPRMKAQVSDRILVRRGRRSAMAAGPFGLLCALVVGALLGYFLDRERGRARRQVGRERIVKAMHFGTAQSARFADLASTWGHQRVNGRTPAQASTNHHEKQRVVTEEQLTSLI